MLKNFTVAMLPILALGTDIVYENAVNADCNSQKNCSYFQTHNRAAEPDSENWIAEDAKKLAVSFKLFDTQRWLEDDEIFEVSKLVLANEENIEMGFAMMIDDDVIDAFRYRQWKKTGEEMTKQLHRRTFNKSEDDGKFKFDSADFKDWTDDVPDGQYNLSTTTCKEQTDEDEDNFGLYECDYIMLNVRRNFVEDTDAWRSSTLVNNNYETMSTNYWGWMRSISQDKVDGEDWNGDEEAAWEDEAEKTTLVDYPKFEDGGLAVETINKAFATTEAMRKAGQEGIDQFEKGFDGWYGPLYDMAKSIADDFKTWNVWWNNQDADVQSGMSDDMKEQWEEELNEWDLSLQMLGSIKQYYLAHISVLGSEMENAKTADEVEAVMAKIEKEKDFVTGQVFKELRSLATQIEEKTAGALTLLTTFQRMIDEGYSFKKKPEIDEE